MNKPIVARNLIQKLVKRGAIKSKKYIKKTIPKIKKIFIVCLFKVCSFRFENKSIEV